jgi:uncharacterized protein (TIGR02266 family)
MGFQAGDNGRAPRIPLALQVEYRCDAQHAFAVGQGTDLSTSGLFVHTDQPRQVGSMIFLRVALRDGSKVAEGFGRVARVGEDASGHLGMGIQFISLDDRSLGLVEEMVARELGEDLGPA